MDGTDNIVTRRALDTVSTILHVTRGQVSVTEVVPMDGTDSIVTRRALDTVSTMLPVTRRLDCVTRVVLLDGVVIHVMKVRLLLSKMK